MKEQWGTHVQNQTQGRITRDLTSPTQTHNKLTKGTQDKIRGGGGELSFSNSSKEVKRKKL